MLLSIAFSFFLGMVLWQFFNIDLLFSWLISVNIVAFLIYGYDKSQAKQGGQRVSERELLVLALIGGSLGALLGMQIFRHKTAKPSFQFRLLLILIFQVILVVGYFLLV